MGCFEMTLVVCMSRRHRRRISGWYVTDLWTPCGLRTWTLYSMTTRCCVLLTVNESNSHHSYTCCLRFKISPSPHQPLSAGMLALQLAARPLCHTPRICNLFVSSCLSVHSFINRAFGDALFTIRTASEQRLDKALSQVYTAYRRTYLDMDFVLLLYMHQIQSL